MPPKKKKSTVSPIVVGTVSTRSTQRQSVVNIDIPKTSRGFGKCTFKSPTAGSTRESSASDNLSEKIKQTYNKMFSKILQPSIKKFQKPELKPTNTSDSRSSVSKDDAVSSAREERRSNEALLQILEDWTDDESQDDKKGSNVDETEKVERNIKSDDEENIMSDLVSLIQQQSVIEEAVLEVVGAPMQYEYQKEVEAKMNAKNISKTENSEGCNIIQEFFIDQNQTVPIDEHMEEIVAFDEENVVTEEIVTEENDSFVLMDTAGDNTGTIFEVKQETFEVSQSQSVNSEPFSLETVLCENKETITENLMTEETSQSVSTTDSNDAEVRGFFTGEIGSLKEENLDYEKYVDVKNEDSQNSIFQENVETEKNKNKFVSDENEESEINATTKESEELSLDERNFCEAETDKPYEPMDFSEDTTEDTIETRVAQMHLADEVKGDTSEELSQEFDKSNVDMKYPLKEDIEEVIGVRTTRRHSRDQMKVEEIESCLAKENKSSSDLESLLERPKTRKTRISDTKTVQKQVEEQSETNAAKTNKTKEKKSSKIKESKRKESKTAKESRIKRKPIPSFPIKKPKEKTEKKESAKTDKKDNSKKVVKQDDQLKKISKTDSAELEDTEVRRSSRIKSISVLKKKTTGHGLVRSKSEPFLYESDVSDTNSTCTESEKSTPSASPKVVLKDRKTRWTRSSDNLSNDSQCTADLGGNRGDSQLSEVLGKEVDEKPKLPIKDPVVTARLKQFVHLKENLYKTDRMTCKEAKKMTCDCFLTNEEMEANEYGCGEDCLNRLLFIECGNLCQVADRCTNKRFQKGQFAPVEVFNTEKKGLGLRAAANIPYGEFILEYVGEVLNSDEFDKRAEVYSQDKNIHYYFMSLRADAIIDATMKGNISRFINHSCDPNAETQKWTVNGELRIGFFSTRTILAGEEITFDYRFQRYGKEAQKCYCEAATCRGWLGEEPDEDSEDEDEEEEEEEEEQVEEKVPAIKAEASTPIVLEMKPEELDMKMEVQEEAIPPELKTDKIETEPPTAPVAPKRKSSRKKPRKDLFEELDPLDEEIDMLITTGLKNQAHTLKLSRLMVRAKEPPQRTKLLRILRRGELPCRRLFLDYHGLRLMHGYMIDAQHLVHTDKKFESLRLEVLQTLAVLPIPNKTMLQDSKVLLTVEKWATDKDLGSPQDSDSNSPKNEPEISQPPTEEVNKEKVKEVMKKELEPKKEDELERTIEDQEEEIRFLASKLLEGWTNLKEVFRIPKKERIEQMKEHEREANKKFMQGGYANEPDNSRKSDRYRHLSRYKVERDSGRKGSRNEEKPSAEFIRLSKIERRKLFALQHELKEEERRLKQREMWRQHEVNCMMIGTDPRFTAPFDPSRGYQYIWNPQIGQWQNYPLPAQNQMIFSPQTPVPTVSMQSLPNLSLPPPPKPVPSFPYSQQIPINTSMGTGIVQLPTSMAVTGQMPPLPQQGLAPMQVPNLPTSVAQLTSMQGMPGPLPASLTPHQQIPTSIPSQPPLPQYQEAVKKEDDPTQVKFMGPIPPPAKLPPKWKCAKDKYGRPYYYHIKIRKSQWEPPPYVEPVEEPEEWETESSSDTSSISSESSSENSDSDDDIDDTRLLQEVRKQMEKSAKLTLKSVIPEHVKTDETPTPSPDDDKNSEEDADQDEGMAAAAFLDEETERPSIDIRLKEQFNLLKDDNPPKKKRRMGLCEEIMISPRTEEDRLQFKEDLKRYKANKEKLKRQKELILQQTRKQLREADTKKPKDKRVRTSLKTRIKEMPDFNSEQAKKIKESFRTNMATTVVSSLNGYRKPDCKEGRITNTDDFKHLARKLTHFVMLKEMKHIEKIEDLTCTDNVKAKAREYIKKYMSKFGEMYVKRNDSPDFKD